MPINEQEFWNQLNGSYKISNQVVSGKIIFPNSSQSNPLTIDNVVFNDQVEFKVFKGLVGFKNCEFLKDIIVSSNSSNTTISFDSCSFESFECKENAPISKLSITNNPKKENKKKSRIKYRGSELEIKDCTIIKQLDFHPNICTIENCNIDRLEGTHRGGKINIKDTFINTAILKGWRDSIILQNDTFLNVLLDDCNANMEIKDCLITDISFNKFLFRELFMIKNSSIINCIQFNNSIIDGGSFKNCDFSSAKMQVEDTNLFNIEFDAILWNTEDFLLDKIETDDFEKKKVSKKNYERAVIREHLRIQHIYRHLKQSADKANDRINYQKFKAFELDRYMRTLQFRNSWALKVNLCFGRYTNFFGLWWLAPIGYYILTTLFFYFLLARFPGYIFVHHPFNTIFSDVARFTNPTHSLESIQLMNNSNGWVIMFDYVSRIFQGLLGYQTIRGFRKSFF